jgi:uncharacterized metal-binding protein (TIGR02443 family)
MSLLPDTPKRFVAGAKCPQCQAMDKVMMFRKAGIQYQVCVSCGYQEEMVLRGIFVSLRRGSTGLLTRGAMRRQWCVL